MNVDKILAVADAIEQHAIPDLGFNMAWLWEDVSGDEPAPASSDMSGHECGTVACIAGWAIAVSQRLRSAEQFSVGGSLPIAKSFLGLSDQVAADLFTPPGYARGHHTAVDAVRTLRRLAHTGRVDWSETDEAA